MLKKFKSLVADDAVYMGMLLILVGVVSFGLGQQSAGKVSDQSAGVVFTDLSLPVDPTGVKEGVGEGVVMSEVVTKKLVASRSGSRYHLLTCSGANRIKESNKLFFNSEEEAKAAGYTPAVNCKGL